MSSLQMITVLVLAGLNGAIIYRYGLLGVTLGLPFSFAATKIMGAA